MLLFWGMAALAVASPRITRSMAPVALATRQAQASPSIVLSLAPAARRTLMAQAAPSIVLAMEVQTIGGYVDAGSTVVELEYNAT